MSRRDSYVKFILTALFLAVVVGGCLAIQALDRARAVNLRAMETLRRAEKLNSSPRSVSAASGRDFANAEFFIPGARIGGVLRESIAAEPPNLNPLISNEANAASIYSLCVPSLAEKSFSQPDGEYRPLLAESWEISPDHRSYRIRLRSGIMWDAYTDPVSGEKVPAREVTAADFKFFIDVLLDPRVNCAPLRGYYQDLDGLEILNDREFIVKWKRPYYGSRAATLDMSPLPRHYYHSYPGKFDGERFNDDHKRNAFIVGCGPYRFEKWEKNRRIVLRRNPAYIGAAFGAAPAVETRIFEVIQLPNTRFQALAAGRLDFLELTADQWVRRGKDPIFTSGEFNRYRSLALIYSYIGYNQRSELFRDRRVRQALTMLVDRDRIARDIHHGLVEPVKGPFPPRSKFSDPALKPYPYDPARAKALLAEAGWSDADGDGILEKDGRKFAFTMLQVANHPTQTRMFPLLKESFGAAGIDMRIQTLEWSVYIERLEARNYDACCLGWTSSFDPDPYQIWHSSGIPAPGSNHIGYANPELDKQIELLRSTFDSDERTRIARRIEAIIYEDQPYTFLFAPYSLTAVSSKFDNVRVFPSGLIPRLFVEK